MKDLLIKIQSLLLSEDENNIALGFELMQSQQLEKEFLSEVFHLAFFGESKGIKNGFLINQSVGILEKYSSKLLLERLEKYCILADHPYYNYDRKFFYSFGFIWQDDLFETGELYPVRILGNITKLDLSHKRLSDLPISLRNLTQLEYLNLSSNELVSIPEWIENLTQLEYLDLSYNKFVLIPEWIGNLTQLKKLILSDNQLIDLPGSIEKLIHLQCLDLSYNLTTNDLTTNKSYAKRVKKVLLKKAKKLLPYCKIFI